MVLMAAAARHPSFPQGMAGREIGFDSHLCMAVKTELVVDHSASCILSKRRQHSKRQNHEDQCEDKRYLFSHCTPPLNQYILEIYKLI
jgi:hypothetical protein